MSRAVQKALRLLAWVLLCTLPPQLLRAQVAAQFEPEELSLSALTSAFGGTTLGSSAKVILINAANGRPLVGEIILGHNVVDTTAQNTIIYTKRVVSATGDASNQAFIPGIVPHCYEAGMAAHANGYNLHQTWGLGPVCADPYVPPPRPDVPKENCPVLLDLQQDGFHLSGPDPAVRFDIDADGTPDEIAWTQAGEDEAFLCWDRNRNGVIDDGRELFGYSTPLLSGGLAKVGYRALAELDQAELGGNRDGKVDAGDRTFRELRAWVDRNRDGVSQPHEIHTLEEVGVVALEYGYQTTRLRDSYGNLFRYVSRAAMRGPSGAVRYWPTFDVIFGELQGSD
ncbi:MAG TPA: hypothetical protein VKK31_14425 [Thermoanaerobaculia bacterium]|nr:hypothetical protein [Thermoanaerobaculia bacterium]